MPRVSASVERQVHRVKELGAQKAWALHERGRFGPVVDVRFTSEEGRDLVTGVADLLGLELRRGAAEKVGIAFALLAVGGLLVAGVAVGILALHGKL